MAKDKPIQDSMDRRAPKNLEITQVTYSLLKNLGNYENERIELTAKVYPGDCPNKISVALKERAGDILHVLARVKNGSGK